MEKKTVLQQMLQQVEQRIDSLVIEIKEAEIDGSEKLKIALKTKHLTYKGIVQMLKTGLPAEKAMLEEAYNEGCDDFRVTFETYYSQFLTQPTQNER